jgi:hypothetical protein
MVQASRGGLKSLWKHRCREDRLSAVMTSGRSCASARPARSGGTRWAAGRSITTRFNRKVPREVFHAGGLSSPTRHGCVTHRRKRYMSRRRYRSRGSPAVVHARHSACDNCLICRICRIPMLHVSHPEKRRGARPKSERVQILRSETCSEPGRPMSHLSHLSHPMRHVRQPEKKAWRAAVWAMPSRSLVCHRRRRLTQIARTAALDGPLRPTDKRRR